MQTQANIFSLYINNSLQLSLTDFLNVLKWRLSTVTVSGGGCLTNAQLKTGAFPLLQCSQHIQQCKSSPATQSPLLVESSAFTPPPPHVLISVFQVSLELISAPDLSPFQYFA